MKITAWIILLVGLSVAPVSAQSGLRFGYAIGMSNPSTDMLSLNAMLDAELATPIRGIGLRADALLQNDAGTAVLGFISLKASPSDAVVRPYVLAGPGLALTDDLPFVFGLGMGVEVMEGPVPLFVEFRGILASDAHDFSLVTIGLRF